MVCPASVSCNVTIAEPDKAINALDYCDKAANVINDRRARMGATMSRIEYTITIDDPKTYTKPWTSVRNWYLHPEWEIMEYSCEENNKDLYDGHIKGPKLGSK